MLPEDTLEPTPPGAAVPTWAPCRGPVPRALCPYGGADVPRRHRDVSRVRGAQPEPPRPGRWGLPQNPCSGGNFWRPGDGSFATGWGSFRPRRPAPAPDRLPAEERLSGPEGEDPLANARELMRL
jgi:hypothetical protein